MTVEGRKKRVSFMHVSFFSCLFSVVRNYYGNIIDEVTDLESTLHAIGAGTSNKFSVLQSLCIIKNRLCKISRIVSVFNENTKYCINSDVACLNLQISIFIITEIDKNNYYWNKPKRYYYITEKGNK